MASPDRNCINPLEVYSQFSPSLSGLTRGEPLYEFFLPMVQTMANQHPDIMHPFEDGFSCLGYARLTVELFGGPNCARIFWVEKFGDADAEGWIHDWIQHAYVVPANVPVDSQAFNSMGFEKYTVYQVLSEGKDITEEVLALPWNSL